MILIREYAGESDREQLRECIVELQDYERALEPCLPQGEVMADDYLRFLLRRCDECSGKVLLAVVDGALAGFVCVLTRVSPAEPDEAPLEYAYISDLLVKAAYRGRGIGQRLLGEAEILARSTGARQLRVGVLARNRAARELYGRLGFAEYHVQLNKTLAQRD